MNTGPDIAYVSRNDEAERARIPKWSGPTAARWEHLWPADDYQPQPHAERSLAWTNWPLFTVGLVQHGHSDETIRKILGDHWRHRLPQVREAVNPPLNLRDRSL